eukprot:jgi/Ulvmu1/10263/UM060_0064.1
MVARRMMLRHICAHVRCRQCNPDVPIPDVWYRRDSTHIHRPLYTENYDMADQDGPIRRELIIPVDETPEARRACEWMLDNLYRPGDMVNIIHIVPRISTGADDVPMWFGVYELPLEVPASEDVVEKGLQMVKEHILPLFSPNNVPHKVHILEHHTDTETIAKSIAAKADELGAHSITLAHHHKGTLTQWFLGSVCSELIKIKPGAPLVIVR